jgi:hypothetical protein
MARVLRLAAALAFALLPCRALQAQSTTGLCTTVPPSHVERCLAAVQAAHSVQPQLGLLLVGAGSTPALHGRRWGPLAGVAGAARLGMVPIRFPDVLVEDDAPVPPPVSGMRRVTTIALGLDGSAVLLPGARAGSLAGLGSVELLVGLSYVPLDLISREAFPGRGAELSWSGGARIGLVGESGALPAVSLSLLYRRVGEMTVGNACEGTDRADPRLEEGARACYGAGDAAEASFDLATRSARANLSRAIGPVRLGASLGRDRHEGDLSVIVRGPDAAFGEARARAIYPRGPVGLDTGRWSGFLDAGLAVEGAELSAAFGWMQGGERIPGYRADADFDPARGSTYAGFSVRLVR